MEKMFGISLLCPKILATWGKNGMFKYIGSFKPCHASQDYTAQGKMCGLWNRPPFFSFASFLNTDFLILLNSVDNNEFLKKTNNFLHITILLFSFNIFFYFIISQELKLFIRTLDFYLILCMTVLCRKLKKHF